MCDSVCVIVIVLCVGHLSYLRLHNVEEDRAWDADQQDGARFDFIDARLSDLSSTLAELETMGESYTYL